MGGKMGIAINGAASGVCVGSRLRKSFLERIARLAPEQLPVYHNLLKANCATDIMAILINLAKTASLLSLSSVHCPGIMQLKAICVTGITSLITGLTGIADAAAG